MQTDVNCTLAGGRSLARISFLGVVGLEEKQKVLKVLHKQKVLHFLLLKKAAASSSTCSN